MCQHLRVMKLQQMSHLKHRRDNNNSYGMQTLEEHIRGALAAQDSSTRSLHDGVARAALGRLLLERPSFFTHRCLLQMI